MEEKKEDAEQLANVNRNGEKAFGMLLQDKGYFMIPSNVPEYTMYYQMENNLVNVIQVIGDHEGFYLDITQINHVKESIRKLFQEKGYENIHILSLIFGSHVEKIKPVMEQDDFCWFIDTSLQRLVLYENQVVDFYGLKNTIEEWVLHGMGHKEMNEEMEYSPVKKSFRAYPYVTITITVLNVLIFLICTFTGDLLYNVGALNAQEVFQNRQFYRIISCMFLHADVHHLFSNMVMYYFLGEIVEKNLGHLKYFVMYFLSGVGGGLLSMGFSMFMGSNVDSVGASGAIFGVVGALLWLALTRRGELEHITLGKVLFLIIYSLYSGFTGTHIDNAAHIGGLITGFLCTLGMRSVNNEG